MIALSVVLMLDSYVFNFEKGSTACELVGVIILSLMIVMCVHGIRFLVYFIKFCKNRNCEFLYQSWKKDYNIKNHNNNKTEDELMAIFYNERKAMELEKNKELSKLNQELIQKKLEAYKQKSKEKEEMARLRNTGRTVSPYKESRYQSIHNNNVARCPKCGSTSLTANKKGFSATKGVIGLAVSPLAGAVVGSTGKNKVIVTCLKCGHQWKAGKK